MKTAAGLDRQRLPRPLRSTFRAVAAGGLLSAGWAGACDLTLLSAQTSPALEIMQRYRQQDRTATTEVQLAMTLIDNRGRERGRALRLWTHTDEKGRRSQLIQFTAPPDVRGTGFLSIEGDDGNDDAWLYLPALRRTRRIASADRTDRFVGTDFTFEDLEAENLSDFRYELTGEDPVADVPAWRIRAIPTDPDRIAEGGYGARDLWISQETSVLLKAEIYSAKGTFLRRMTAEDVRLVPGTERWRPFRLVMEDVVSGGRTVLVFESYRIDQGLPDDLFTERYLRRGR